MQRGFIKITIALLSTLCVFAILVFVQEHNRNTGQAMYSLSTSNLWSSFVWDKYVSHNAGITFELPKGWTVIDRVQTLPSLKGDYWQRFNYVVLAACPPKEKLIFSEKGGWGNCVLFETKTTMTNPPIGFMDESLPLTSNFNKYIFDESNNYVNFRVIQQMSASDQDAGINLVGLYRNHQNVVGAMQAFCNEDETARCILIFKHMIDSISFLNVH